MDLEAMTDADLDQLREDVADVHAYAVATYEPTPRPGENPSAVTDDQIEAAVAAVRDAQQPDA